MHMNECKHINIGLVEVVIYWKPNKKRKADWKEAEEDWKIYVYAWFYYTLTKMYMKNKKVSSCYLHLYSSLTALSLQSSQDVIYSFCQSLCDYLNQSTTIETIDTIILNGFNPLMHYFLLELLTSQNLKYGAKIPEVCA